MATKKIRFLGIGPQRTGSTWLFESLQGHPQIAWPQGVKETFFFDERFEKGFDWYYWHFKDARQECLAEIGPTYFDSPQAAARIKEHVPDCKLIINVRNPIEKTFSVFRHFHSLGEVSKDFDQAVREKPRLIECGRYRKYSEMWEQHFSFESVLYLVHDDIKRDPQECLDSVCKFLGLDPWSIREPNRVVNAGGTPMSPTLVRGLEFIARRLRALRLHQVVNLGKAIGLKRLYRGGKDLPGLTDSQKQMLCTEFKEDISWLEQKLSRDFSHWYE